MGRGDNSGKGGFKPVAPGPVNGVPPTLEWVAIERLNIDESYQRATDGPHSQKIITGMVRTWEWSLCQPLVVSRRGDGSLWVLDGQHRLAGARRRGDILHLPCVLLHGQDTGGEASAFVALNTRRQKLSQSDVFNGMLAAGDENAKSVQILLERTGWRIVRHTNTACYGPGELASAPMLVNALRVHGEAVVSNALASLREAYPDKPVRNGSTLLKALIAIYRDKELEGEDPDTFIEALGTVEPQDWDEFGREQRRKYPVLSRIESLSAAMMATYREHVLEVAA